MQLYVLEKLLGDNSFSGRASELARFNGLLTKKIASLAVVRGRRRVGKSRLITEFAKNKTFLAFSGLAPEERITAQRQRDEFAIQLSQQTGLPEVSLDDWSKLFLLLADKIKTGRVVVLFDEITWMAHGDASFLPKLKNAWDLHFKKNSKLILVLCGSVSAWIEKNIINSTGFFGRIALEMVVKELPITKCSSMLDNLGFRRSPYEKQVYLNIVGGVPWYLELIDPKLSAEDNIKQLCFAERGMLVNEYQRIFNDLFGHRSVIYQNIVAALTQKALDYTSLSKKIDYPKGSSLLDYIYELKEAGYVQSFNAWDLKSGQLSALNKYRLSDNYLRFYLKYMLPKLESIKAGRLKNIELQQLPGWKTILGLQFENTVLNNRELILQRLNINPSDVLNDGPYFQNKTTRQTGCQIDYMIQTRAKTLFVCEVKFFINSVGTRVITEMEEKLKALSLPRGVSVVPVLIYFGELDEKVVERDYFYQCVNLADFFD